jgi:uncharacterized protein (TIGR03435 family)
MKLLACILLAARLSAQTAEFEVATMKAAPPGEPFRLRTSDGALLHYPSVSLLGLLREAYRLKRPEQVEGPAWMRTQAYTIEAKLPANASQAQIPEMLQALLTDRLQLSVHHETRRVPTNVLVVAKRGPKMRRATVPDENLELRLEIPMVHLRGRGSMEQLIDNLNHGLGGPNPWVDSTGLSGPFDIDLEFDLSPDSPSAQHDETAGAPKLAQALAEQLGLLVNLRKAPADIVVVDRVERVPADN